MDITVHLKTIEDALSRMRVSPFGLPITPESQYKEIQLIRCCLDQVESGLLEIPTKKVEVKSILPHPKSCSHFSWTKN